MHRDRNMEWTYSGNGSGSWVHKLGSSAITGQTSTASSTEKVNLNGGTNWRISVYFSKPKSWGIYNGSPGGYVSGTLKFYY